jgi:ubiquinone/menaquinone biosynthesis C-methylase UbiE
MRPSLSPRSASSWSMARLLAEWPLCGHRSRQFRQGIWVIIVVNGARDFTPALGDARWTPFYDWAVAISTRENVWRQRLISQISPIRGDRILDIGCGTGSLAIRLKARAQNNLEVVGLDPDPVVLTRARAKAERKRLEIMWHESFLTEEIVADLGPFTKIVSSLVFHQTPLAEKERVLNLIYAALLPGGTLHIADYGAQRTSLMRFLFRQTVQRIDGVEDTQPNADGVLPRLIQEAGFNSVAETTIIPTLTGSISLYQGKK